ncbi:MAG: guanylate kinase [Clostridia bacterium]|nr:guanylate kinase [Clostridia bacterium]MBQ7789504.1 guanylate kinase [Clostridia bacterium]
MRKGLLFIISGPAGSGKGTVVNALLKAHPELKLSISATTRSPRPGEINGVHYYYISKDEFKSRIENGKMLEYTVYSDNYYGTPEKEVVEAMENGNDVILEIEVDGAMQIKEKISGSVAIMLTPPDKDVLEARLRGRGTETEDVIKWRLERAKEEIQLLPKYDYSVVNEDGKIEECAEAVYSIIKAEHQKTIYTRSIIEKFI